MSAEFTITGHHTHVAVVGGHHWPAWEHPDGIHVAVDLRLFEQGSMDAPKKTFQPEELRKLGVPEETIEAASKCSPISGFCLMSKRRAI